MMLSLVWWITAKALPCQVSTVQLLLVRMFSILIKFILKGIGFSFLFPFLLWILWKQGIELVVISAFYFNHIFHSYIVHAIPFPQLLPDPTHFPTHPILPPLFFSVKRKTIYKTQNTHTHTHTHTPHRIRKQNIHAKDLNFLFCLLQQ